MLCSIKFGKQHVLFTKQHVCPSGRTVRRQCPPPLKDSGGQLSWKVKPDLELSKHSRPVLKQHVQSVRALQCS